MRCKRLVIAALCGLTLAGVAAPVALAADRPNSGVGEPFFRWDRNGVKWGVKWIGPDEGYATQVTGPGAFGPGYLVIIDVNGEIQVAPRSGEGGSEEAAEDLAEVLNNPEEAVPTPGPSSAMTSPNRPVVPSTLTTTTDCWATLPLQVGQLAGRAAGSTPATVVIDWGDGSPNLTFSTAVGASHNLVHQFRPDPAYSEVWTYEGMGMHHIVHGVSVRVIVDGVSYYGGVFVRHPWYDPEWTTH